MSDTHPMPNAPNGYTNGHAPELDTWSSSELPSGTPRSAEADGTSLETRLAAQTEAVQPSERGAGNLNDPIGRPQDAEGLPKPRPLVYLSPGLLSARSLKETTLPRLLELLSKHSPARAEWLGFTYEEGLRFNKEQFDDLDRLERESLSHENAEIVRRNKALTALQEQLERERDDRTQHNRAALTALDAPTHQAQCEAVKSVAATGGDYDPSNPTSECVLRARPLPLEVVVGDAGLPWTPADDDKRVPVWLLHALKIGVGVAIGLSIGIVSHFFDKESVGKKPLELLVAVGLGCIAAVGGGWAMRGSTRRASERYWLARFGGFGPFFWVPSTVFAKAVGLTLIGAEATVDMLALFGSAQLENQNDGGTVLPWIVFYIVGLLMTIGYMVTMANEGSFDGRRDVCLNRAKWLQHNEFAAREKEEKADHQVRSALAALGGVREMFRQRTHLEAKIAQIAQPLEQKIEALESLKREPVSMSDEAKQHLRDIFDNWCGSNSDWHDVLQGLLDKIEPMDHSRQRSIGDQTNRQPLSLFERLREWGRRMTRR